MATTLLIAGHGKLKSGGNDPGATGLISKGEHRYMKENLFPAMKKYLPSGADVVFFSDYKVLDYGNLVALANKYGKDTIVVECHYDAATAAARGGHVIVHKDFSPDAIDLRLRDAIKENVGVRYNHKGQQGISGRSDLGNVNRAKNGGVNYRLIELGFGTNKDDVKAMVDNVDKYAKSLVEALLNKEVKAKPKTETKKPAPAKASKPSTNKYPAAKSGEGIVDYLKRIKVDSSMTNRKKLAASYGIKKYSGTASQNTQLLDKMSGSSKSSKSIEEMAKEIINNSKIPNGHDARRKYFGISAAEYEKVRARVNQLL